MGKEVIRGVLADHWLLQAEWTSSDNHYYCTPDADAKMVRFMEHEQEAVRSGGRDGDLKVWTLDLAAFSGRALDPSRFGPPVNASCNAPCAVIRKSGYPGCTWTGASTPPAKMSPPALAVEAHVGLGSW